MTDLTINDVRFVIMHVLKNPEKYTADEVKSAQKEICKMYEKALDKIEKNQAKPKMETRINIFLTAVILITITSLVSLLITNSKWKAEAIQEGHAEYHDKDGSKIWRWKATKDK